MFSLLHEKSSGRLHPSFGYFGSVFRAQWFWESCVFFEFVFLPKTKEIERTAAEEFAYQSEFLWNDQIPKLNFGTCIQPSNIFNIMAHVSRTSRTSRQNGARLEVKYKSCDFWNFKTFPMWSMGWSMQLSHSFSTISTSFWARSAPLFCGFLASATLDDVF